MKKKRIVMAIMCATVVMTIVWCWYYIYTPVPVMPKLSAAIQGGSIRINGMDRTYQFYVPAHVHEKAPLVFVLHGSMQGPEDIRKYTGYQFDLLADSAGFIVVYPSGFKHNWNDCRKAAAYPARTENIADKELIRALIERFRKDFGADASRVFATGYSNGGHFAFRLALEMPDAITAVAAASASLPAQNNTVCVSSGKPVPVMIMNGTEDPINPYNGGSVSLIGFGNRGAVLSSLESARYFARLAGYGDTPDVSEILPHRGPSGQTGVRREIWRASGRPEIVLYTVIGGGHCIPQPVYRPIRLLGKSTSDINGPAEIWEFFARQAPLGRPYP